jgi:hypothetical protein
VWADDEAKGAPERRDEKVSLDQVPLPVKATIERESAGGQVTGISRATERGEAAYAVKIAKDGLKDDDARQGGRHGPQPRRR